MENKELSLDAKIEALLFYKGEPVSLKEISKVFDVTEDDVKNSVSILKEKLNERGLTLVVNEKEIMLGTTPELSSFFEELRKEELSKELSRASLETLSIILYKENVSRADIDYIRGVNSGFILRNLQIRGLIDKSTDSRNSVYRPSLELLSYLGVSSAAELPDYENIVNSLKQKVDQLSHENTEI